MQPSRPPPPPARFLCIHKCVCCTRMWTRGVEGKLCWGGPGSGGKSSERVSGRERGWRSGAQEAQDAVCERTSCTSLL